jgi:SWI/SNF-related matrix-associated actin-dependent regulator 1 of chromatin subfamily A
MPKREKRDGLAQRANNVLLLTGTPILNKPIEIYPLLSTLNPAEFGNFWAFAKRYCGATQTRYGWDFSGATNLPELQERMRAACMVRRLKKDVLTELPAKRRQIVTLATNGAANAVRKENEVMARHEQNLSDLRTDADLAHASGDKEAYEIAARKLQAASRVAFTEISATRHAVAVAKIPYVIEHVQSIMEEGCEKLILFAHHHDVVDALAAEFSGECVVLTGETPMDERQSAVERFQTDPNVRIFIGSITAAGVGLTLTAASTVVFAELDWTPANVSQAEDRAHRIGQTQSVLVQHLVLDGSLDARMAQVIVDKQNVADQALDNATELSMPVTPNETPRPRRYPIATATQHDAAIRGIRALRTMCDGVVARDGMGFSGATARAGHSLAKLDKFTDGQVFLATKLCTIHRRQLPDDILVALGIEVK